MFVPFDSLPDTARVWVYQANRTLGAEEKKTTISLAEEFLQQWEAHGAPLKSSFMLSHDQFLIIGVDERANPVTGCSTDAQVRFVQLLQQRIEVDFFDRTQVALLVDNDIVLVPLNALRQKNVSVPVEESTVTFNNLVTTKAQLTSEWMQPAGKTWLARYI